VPTYRFPVLVWEDCEGYYTAILVEEGFGPAALAGTVDDALLQVKEYLAWFYKQQAWMPGPDFFDPQLIHFKVVVRPEYHVRERIYPSDDPLSLKVACVHGHQEGGLLISSLPMLDIHFYYYEQKTLKDLVTHYVREKLKGLTPQELSRYLPPKNALLEEVVIHVDRRDPKFHLIPKLATLGSVAEPLGQRALRRQFSRAYEREREVADLVQRLGKEKANVILAGDTGVGKTSVVVEAVRQIERQIGKPKAETDETSHPRKFWLTSGARLIAGMQYLGQWEQRVEQVIEELAAISGVLAVENLLDLAHTGGRSPNDSIAAFLLPYLQRGELQMIGEATPAELDACRRLLPGFADVFQTLNLAPFDRGQAVSVLDRVAATLKSNAHVEVQSGVIDLVYRLFKRFAPYLSFPGKAVAFLTELFDRASLDRASEITTRRVIEQFVRQTGLPEFFLRDEIPLVQEEVVETFARQVIGQREACLAAASLVTTFKAGLNDPNRPIGVLLFCGPTGVGKTELARAVSRFFFGHGEPSDRLVRLDMSEYAGPGAGARLLVGLDGEPSDFIKRVRQQPLLVLLLDEIEKASAEVFDILLSVFDEGRLTDRYGRVTTFQSAIILMTSNLGADKFEAIGFGKASAPSYAAEAISFFRPEFFNRIDRIVRFNPLDEAMILAIARKELSEICQREGLAKANVSLVWTDGVVRWLAKEGFDPRYGARPLQRAIEMLVITPLARYLIERPEIKNRTIRLDAPVGARGIRITI
jgi:ATP-dependent Clp protease ATP-binding subunit ClpC